MADRYYLARFKNAQEFGVYEKALAEIKNGRKMGHWMWFIFPQLRGFGHTRNTWFYGITCADEARAYLQDEVLAKRLREISEALLEIPQNDPRQVMGDPDWLKLGSCMTLFDYVSPNDVFDRVLRKFYSGSRDPKSLEILKRQAQAAKAAENQNS
jgi:uncharacterized protein (DUF1810 family)